MPLTVSWKYVIHLKPILRYIARNTLNFLRLRSPLLILNSFFVHTNSRPPCTSRMIMVIPLSLSLNLDKNLNIRKMCQKWGNIGPHGLIAVDNFHLGIISVHELQIKREGWLHGICISRFSFFRSRNKHDFIRLNFFRKKIWFPLS